MPNFDEISQSMAKIKLLPFSENSWPPYWNSISCFDFDEIIVIDMTFCICVIKIGGRVMTPYQFYNMAAIDSEMYFRVQV